MENVNNWYFTKEQLANSPSRRAGIDINRELSYRQQAANFIQDMGQRLQVSQLCINTAIVYMHRFYAFHSFSDIHRNNISTAALFLAAKVEEQPRKLEHVIKVAHVCLHKDSSTLDVRSEAYSERMNEIVFHENLLLQTLGFVLAIEHPHTYVVKVCQLVKASKDLAQTSYIMATTSLHMTTMCLMYKPTLVACVCIHLACKWSSYMIEPCSEGRDWFYYVDRTVTKDILEKLTQEYISILERSPHRFKKKFGKDAASGYHGPSSISMDESSLPNRPSTSSEGSSTNKESSPGTYDFGSDFEEKRALESPFRYEKPTSNHAQPAPLEAVPIKKEKAEPPLAIKTDSRHLKPKHRLHHAETNSNNVPPASSSSSLPASRHSTTQVSVKVEVTQESPLVKPSEPAKPQVRVNSLPPEPVPEVLQPPPPPPPVLLPLPQVIFPRGLSPIKDIKTNGSKEDQVVERKSSHENDVSVSKRKSPEGKHERREKHKKHSSHSSRDRSVVSNHSDGIKVKIRKDILNLSDPTTMPLKIKLPKPAPVQETPPAPSRPPKQETPTPSLKLVLTKDKSGSGSYSTSQHKNDRERKRGHQDGGYKNSHEGAPPSKYHKSDHGGTPKSHHVDGHKPNKASSRHRSSGAAEHMPNPHRPSNDSTFQNYNNPGYQNYHYQMTPPPPPPKLRGHNLPSGKTNSNPPLPPPLPPPPPPPPE